MGGYLAGPMVVPRLMYLSPPSTAIFEATLGIIDMRPCSMESLTPAAAYCGRALLRRDRLSRADNSGRQDLGARRGGVLWTQLPHAGRNRCTSPLCLLRAGYRSVAESRWPTNEFVHSASQFVE